MIDGGPAHEHKRDHLAPIEMLTIAAITGILDGFEERGLTSDGTRKILQVLLAESERMANDGD